MQQVPSAAAIAQLAAQISPAMAQVLDWGKASAMSSHPQQHSPMMPLQQSPPTSTPPWMFPPGFPYHPFLEPPRTRSWTTNLPAKPVFQVSPPAATKLPMAGYPNGVTRAHQHPLLKPSAQDESLDNYTKRDNYGGGKCKIENIRMEHHPYLNVS